MNRARTGALAAAALLAVGLPAATGAPKKAGPAPFCGTTVGGKVVSAPCTAVGLQRATNVGTFEPTLGADAEGRLFYARADRNGVTIGFGAGVTRSNDAGRTWHDVTPQIAGQDVPPETNDPYVYVDPGTGRVFSFHMGPILLCSMLSFSDDAGETWTTNPIGCGPTGPWDHQTMVAAKPRGAVPTTGYPNVLLQCVNAVYAVSCSRSLDGGRTWGPSIPASENQHIVANRAGEQTGHLAAAPDGTIYLPSPEGGLKPVVFVSEDSGLTWRRQVIADVDIPFTDPAIDVDKNGTVYASFVDETGRLYYTTSRDAARTWTKPIAVTSPKVTATKPTLVVGDPGKVAIAYPGTDDLPDRFATEDYPDGDFEDVRWGGFISVAMNGLSGKPRFQTVEATGRDALEVGASCTNGGRCDFQVDFIDVVTRPDGTVWAAFADGCPRGCTTGATAAGVGVVVTLTKGGDLCASTCPVFREAD